METIKIVKSNRKTFSLEVKRDGSVILRAPLFATNRQIEEFYNKNKAWLYHILNKNNLKATDVFNAFYRNKKTYIIKKSDLI